MGWLFSQRNPNKRVNRKLYAESTMSPSDKYEILHTSVAGGNAYSAVKELATGKVFCAVTLIKVTKYEVGHKGMDEEMGPYYYECPAKVLDLLTPSDNENVVAWREKCRAYAIALKKYNSIKYGDFIVTDEPIFYGKAYGWFKTFRCTDKRRNIYMAYREKESVAVRLNKSALMRYGFKITTTKKS